MYVYSCIYSWYTDSACVFLSIIKSLRAIHSLCWKCCNVLSVYILCATFIVMLIVHSLLCMYVNNYLYHNLCLAIFVIIFFIILITAAISSVSCGRTEQSFLNIFKSNQIWIVITLFPLIWH